MRLAGDVKAVWTGAVVLVWSGSRVVAYDPRANSWSRISTPPLRPRTGESITWTGRSLVVWGGLRLIAHKPYAIHYADGASLTP